MKADVRRFGLLTIAVAGIIGLGTAQAETLTGQINGYGCATGNKLCPVDRLDPHIVMEPRFVLQTGDGGYYFLVNVPRDVKVRYVLETVRVEGDRHTEPKSIVVDELQAKRDDEFETVWTPHTQAEEARLIYEGGSWFKF